MTALQRGYWMAVVALVLAGNRGFGADALKWDSAANRVDAIIETWTVPELLERVSTATGWQIFIDPGISNRIATRFTAKEPGDALRRLLGDYNYALVPQTNAAAKLFVFRNSRDQATRPIQALASKKKRKALIDNELVVTMKPGEKIDELAKKLGAKVVGKSDGLNTSRLQFDDEASAQAARAALENDPDVEGVDNNYYVSRPETPQSLGTAGGPLSLVPKASPDGNYTVVGVVDSAVQPKQGNFADFLLPGVTIDEAKSSAGEPTHATTMINTLLQTLSATSDDKSTTVRIYPVDVFTQQTANGAKAVDATTTYDIALGVYKAVNGGAMIVNLSLGGEGDSKFLHNTIKSAYDQGVVFIAAAGNEPVRTPTYPAAYPEVIAVTASDRSGNLASYANRGEFVDVMAPGGSIISFQGQQYFVAGTSAATAHVSGLAAAISEANRGTGQSLRMAILQALAPKK